MLGYKIKFIMDTFKADEMEFNYSGHMHFTEKISNNEEEDPSNVVGEDVKRAIEPSDSFVTIP